MIFVQLYLYNLVDSILPNSLFLIIFLNSLLHRTLDSIRQIQDHCTMVIMHLYQSALLKGYYFLV